MNGTHGLSSITSINKHTMDEFHPSTDDGKFFTFLFSYNSRRLSYISTSCDNIKQPLMIGHKKNSSVGQMFLSTDKNICTCFTNDFSRDGFRRIKNKRISLLTIHSLLRSFRFL